MDNLASAIETMINTPAIQQKAAQLGEKLQDEDSIANAVQFVEDVVKG